MLVIYDPGSHMVKRIVISDDEEAIHPSHVQSGEESMLLPAISASPFDHTAFTAALAPYGLIMP